MLADQSVQISVNAERLTGEAVRLALQKFLQRRDKPAHGEQTLEELNAQNRELRHADFDKTDLESIRRELKHYAVDFHVMQAPDGSYQLFFKAQDIDRVYEGVRQYVRDLERPYMDTQIKDAAKEADARNAAAAEKAAEKAAERTAEQAAEEAAKKAAEAVVSL